METPERISLATSLEIQVLARKSGEEWQEIDRGPGLIHLPAGEEIAVRIKGIGDDELALLIKELAGCPGLYLLNLSENRNVTDAGLAHLKDLPGLRALNLSSCSLTNTGLDVLKALTHLERLDLSYCNRLTDACVKALKSLNRLTFLDLQGCVKITNGGLARLRRRDLTIHK